jgi:ribbon-helix-helix CopG family protein
VHRTTVHLTQQQLEWLRRQAQRLGITFGELLRRIIDKERLKE